jgi:pimeloyl-ACP methyl ester carboxylesterase
MRLEHGRVGLELHTLAASSGPPLLLLHELYGSSADWNMETLRWPGPVYGLDFTGHGRSDHLRGGAYLPELLLADADTALTRIGDACVAGRGFGAYVALLLAGARAASVPASLLLPGRGLAGGGDRPSFAPEVFTHYLAPTGEPASGADRRVRALELDVRPADYAAVFARSARRLLLREEGTPRPPWWRAVGATAAAVVIDGGEADCFRALLAAASAT